MIERGCKFETFLSAEPTQRVNGQIAVIASPPDARYAPLAAGGPRTFDAVRALVFQVGPATIDKASLKP